VDLLRQKHQGGRRFDPVELIEQGERVAVQLHDGVFKVFTFEGGEVVLLEDCIDRDDALAKLAATG
jgi:hypothetical protein